MKTLLRWLNYRPFLLTLLGFVTTSALVTLGIEYDLSKSDWGTWVGAIGTAAALFGTIYLARTETRRRERAEHDLALITAASFSIRIPELVQALKELERELDINRDFGSVINCSRCVAVLARVDTWTHSDLGALLPIGRGLVVRLGLAHAEVSSIMGRLKQVERGGPAASNPQQNHSLKTALIDRIDVTMQHLKGTREECLAFLLRAGIDDGFAVSRRAMIERSRPDR